MDKHGQANTENAEQGSSPTAPRLPWPLPNPHSTSFYQGIGWTNNHILGLNTP